MKCHISGLVPVLLAVAGLWSCQREAEEPLTPEPAAEAVSFSAAAAYAAGEPTRTEFSGVVVSSDPGSDEGVERIDWITGDPMTILYAAGNTVLGADYAVTSVAASGSASTADIAATDGDGLTWRSGSAHTFCAVYPSAGYGGTSTSLTRNAQGTFVAGTSIPAAQLLTLRRVNGTEKYLPDMKYGLMVASRTLSSAGGTVSLPFIPAVSTLEFSFKRKDTDDSYKIRELRVRSESGSLSGAYTVDVADDGSATTWGNLQVSGGGNVLSVTFDTDADGTPDDVELDSEAATSFTVLLVPSAVSQVTLELVFADGTVRNLPLRDNDGWQSFAPGRKYLITNYKVPTVVGGWSYMVDAVDDIDLTGHEAVSGLMKVVRSYKYSAIHPGTHVAVPWMLQYSSDGERWTDVQGTGPLGQTAFTVTDLEAGALTLGITGTASYSEGSGSIAADDVAEMAARAPFTASGTYFDLSTHPSYGILGATAPAATARYTANCYVVSRPGQYEFPCVYGNAITNGETNYASFAPGHANSPVKGIEAKVSEGDVHWARNFRNAGNAAITDPWIVDDLSATSLSAVILQGSDIVSSATVADGADGKYIRFSIAAGNIKPGNVVIALKGSIPGRSGSEVLWSWHIWVTNKDLSPVTIAGRQMMDWNLGWADSPGVALRQYDDRSLRFRIVQTDDGGNVLSAGDIENFTVTQHGDASYTGANYGTNPCYQWGRKDPLAMDAALSVLQYRPYNKTTVADTWDFYIETCAGLHTPDFPAGYGSDADYGFGIRNPQKAVTNSFTSCWVGGPVVPEKYWNAQYHYNTDTENKFYELVSIPPYDHNDCIYYWVPNDYTPHFGYNLNLTDFHFFGMLSYPQVNLASYETERKTVTSAAYNLWNAYCWADSDFRSAAQVYKTIYDPCPPGFTVPSSGAFNNAGTPSAHTSGNATDGIVIDGHFFPFSGARAWSATRGNGEPMETDVYHWGHTIALNARGVGTSGYLWTAQRQEVKIIPETNFNRDNHLAGIGGGRMFIFTGSSVTLPGSDGGIYTLGSTAPVRPMVDPRYAARVSGVDGGSLEDVEYGTLPGN